MKKILVVDDDRDFLYMIEKMLREEKYDVVTATNADDGLNLARSEKVDLIILDVMMPGKDGTYVAKKLQDDSTTSSIPVIFLTGLYSKEEEAVKGRNVAGKTFLAKPYKIEDLLSEIQKLV